MNWITRTAVGRRSVTLLLAAGLFVAGLLSWGSLKQELLPDVAFPVATVIAPFPAAGADDVASQVVAPIERAIQSVGGVDQVRTYIDLFDYNLKLLVNAIDAVKGSGK